MNRPLKVAWLLLVAIVCPVVALASVSVSLTPTTVHVQPGGQMQFAAVVSGTTNSVVLWGLAGTTCSGIACGQITSGGLYLAPATAPASNVITVTATSLADLSASASATVILGSSSDIAVSVSPATASVLVGQQQRFVTFVSGTTITGVTWRLAGTNCGGSACGTLTSDGLYTAPTGVPSPPQVTVTATSVADPSMSGSAVVTVVPPVAVSISPAAAQVVAGAQKQFTATVTGTTNASVSWSIIGSGCTGAACGTITASGLYTAPSAVPSPPQVSVTATSMADATKSATASVTIIPPVSVTISPTTEQLLTGGHQQFTATVINTANTAVSWSLAGNGCTGAACGTISTSGLYTAPSSVPSPPQVSVTATSVADPTKSATASVTIIPPVSVTISPLTAHLITSGHQQFTATVTGATNTAVSWSLAGSGCTGAACGTISASGLYTAPSSVPSPPQVSVTATSVADPTKSATASLTIGLPVSVTISPLTVQLLTGGHQQFTATVTNTTNTAVSWSLAGSGCTAAACGTISTSGLYTAPSSVPSPPQISVTATSVADPTKSATASLTIIPPVSVTISPLTVELVTGGHQQFAAAVNGTSNSAVSWSVAGSGCAGAVCGTISASGLYTAPSSVPSPPQISVTATSVADPTKSATASVTIVPPVSVTISPTTAQLLTGGHQQFTATVTNTTNTAVSWSVAGSGCTGATCGTITTSGLYTSPSTVPSPPQVSVTATSVADPTKSATASVTIIPPVSVTVSPATTQLLAGGHQQFTATVTGTSNTAVSWTVAGSGCAGATCGSISTTGFYTAPSAAPTPNQVTVTATSVADSTKSGHATVTISEPISVSIAPLSVQVVIGSSQQFTATVSGTSNTSVSWSIAGAGCSGATCGTISPTGLYFAPAAVPSPAQVFVTATLAADATKSSTATVTIVPPVVVTLSPTVATLTVGGQRQFTATVSGSTNTAIAWSVSGSGCSGASCGVVSSKGLYTAPASVPAPPQVTVKAASVATPTSYRRATVTITPQVIVSVSPSTAQVVAGSDRQFSAIVTGTTNQAVTWTVTGKGCAGLACGTITSTGFYGAPGKVPNPAQVTVTATSVAEPSKSGSAEVTILPPVAVTISPTAVQVVSGGHQQFTATVTGTTDTNVTWSLEGPGCSGSACGIISSGGLYVAPGKIPAPPQVTVKATSQADATKSASAIVTIIAPVLVSISPTSAVVAVNGQQQFRAKVVGSTTTSVDWSISGAACSGSTCGNITSAGLYTAPSAVPSLATVIVKATSQVDVSQSASAIVTIVANQNSKLQGQYAFNFSGFDTSGVYQAAGSLTADGNGNVTAGKEDVNTALGPVTDIAFTGKYQISGDNRGTLTFSSSAGTQTFSFALNSAGTRGRFIEFDDSGIRGSGIIEQQDTSAFNAAALKAPYVLSLAGNDSSGVRIGALAIFDFNGSGDIVGGSMDVNYGGTLLPTIPSLQGTYNVDSTGRGSVRLSVPGFPGGTLQLAFYVVSASKLFLVSTNALSSSPPILGGTAELQSGAPYLTSSFNGATVFSLAGESGNVPQVLVGRIVFDGVSQPLVEFDENTGGAIATSTVLTGAYSVGINGSGTLNLDNSNGLTKVWDMYAIAPNHAYLMDASSSDVGMGELKPQLTEPPFGNIDIEGGYLLGSGEPLVYGGPLYSGAVNFDGVNAVTGSEDISLSSSLSPGLSLRGGYSVSSSSNNGRGTLILTSPGGATIALWVTSASEVLGVGIDSSNSQPVVLHFEQ
jgi:Fe-S cluster assembly iron-binding protein IscA